MIYSHQPYVWLFKKAPQRAQAHPPDSLPDNEKEERNPFLDFEKAIQP
jgi:hypothetical protein